MQHAYIHTQGLDDPNVEPNAPAVPEDGDAFNEVIIYIHVCIHAYVHTCMCLKMGRPLMR